MVQLSGELQIKNYRDNPSLDETGTSLAAYPPSTYRYYTASAAYTLDTTGKWEAAVEDSFLYRKDLFTDYYTYTENEVWGSFRFQEDGAQKPAAAIVNAPEYCPLNPYTGYEGFLSEI